MRVLALALVAFLLAACAGDGAPSDPADARRQAVVDLGIKVAALEYIGDNEARAERVTLAVNLLTEAVEGGKVGTALALAELAAEKIGLEDLAPHRRLLAEAIVELVIADLLRVAGDDTGVLTPELQAKALRLLGLVGSVAAGLA